MGTGSFALHTCRAPTTARRLNRVRCDMNARFLTSDTIDQVFRISRRVKCREDSDTWTLVMGLYCKLGHVSSRYVDNRGSSTGLMSKSKCSLPHGLFIPEVGSRVCRTICPWLKNPGQSDRKRLLR